MHVNAKHVVGALALIVGCVLVGGQTAGADARSDLDSRKRDFDSLRRDFDSRKSEVDRYLENSRSLRSFDKDEMEKLIKSMCAQDVERDGDEADRIDKELTERAVDAVRRKWDDITREWEGTEDRTERTMNDLKSLRDKVKYLPEEDAVKSERSSLLDQVERSLNEVDRLYAKLQDDYRTLRNVKEGAMNGANNPKIRAAVEYGKRKHADMQSSFSCDEKEVVLSSGRPDCVKFTKDNCMILEFKPSSVGESTALNQARTYIEDVQRRFKDDKRAIENCKKDSNGLPLFSADGKTYPACSP